MSAFIKNTSAVMTSGGINNPTIESISYIGYTSGTSPVVFKTKDVARSNESSLITGTTSRFTVLKPCNVTVTAALDISGSGSFYGAVNHYDVANNIIKGADLYGTATQADMTVPLTTKANAGDYFIVQTNGTPVDGTATFFSITATAVEAIQPNFVVSLPTSKENVFSASITGSTGVIVTRNNDWFNLTKNGTGDYTLDITKLGLTTAPAVTALTSAFATGFNISLQTLTNTAIRVRTYNAGETASVDNSFSIAIQKQSPDYTAPGVFVGQVPLDYQYDLTVTGTNWTTTRAVGVVRKMGGGQYRLTFNIVGSNSVSNTNVVLAVNGVTFKNIAGYNQGVSGDSAGATLFGRALSNTGNLDLRAGTTTTIWNVSGDVELDSKPSWAVNTI